MSGEGFAVHAGFGDVLITARWVITSTGAFGPSGQSWRVRLPSGESGSIIVTQSEWGGVDWLHASIALDRMPQYSELVVLHRAVFGRRRYAFQVFAPQSDHINIHPHALHLFGRADGRNPLPDFGSYGTI